MSATAPAGDPIVWTGNLDDDCVAVWNGFSAHAEKMDDGEWYCSVSTHPWVPGHESVFHSTDCDVLPLTGPAARWLCEVLMRFEHAARMAIAVTLDLNRQRDAAIRLLLGPYRRLVDPGAAARELAGELGMDAGEVRRIAGLETAEEIRQ